MLRLSLRSYEPGENVLTEAATAAGAMGVAEGDVRLKELLTEVAVLGEQNSLLSKELADVEERQRRLEFEQLAEKEEARCARVACQVTPRSCLSGHDRRYMGQGEASWV